MRNFVDAHGAKCTVSFSSSERRRFSSAIHHCRSSDDTFEARTDSISEATYCSSTGRAASHSSGDFPMFAILSSIERKALRTSLDPTIWWIIRAWSRKPVHNSCRKIGRFHSSRQACFKVHKQHTRLPLSTVERKGSPTGSSVRVSYQL